MDDSNSQPRRKSISSIRSISIHLNPTSPREVVPADLPPRSPRRARCRHPVHEVVPPRRPVRK
jgi:hypothetical protein